MKQTKSHKLSNDRYYEKIKADPKRYQAYREQQKEKNAAYYERVKQDPARLARYRKLSMDAKRRNLSKYRAQSREWQRSHRAELNFRTRLARALERVRLAEIARGRIPYDG